VSVRVLSLTSEISKQVTVVKLVAIISEDRKRDSMCEDLQPKLMTEVIYIIAGSRDSVEDSPLPSGEDLGLENILTIYIKLSLQ
jgi:hypothetical protein